MWMFELKKLVIFDALHSYQLISPLLFSHTIGLQTHREEVIIFVVLAKILVPPWYERATRRCGHVAIVDVWEHDGTGRARRRFFKCPDLDPGFVV
jgi:hypothetical protein